MMEELAGKGSPQIRTMRVVPVAGHDSMLLNLSGAHAPFFIRNLVVITDASGRVGVGEVPGGESIRRVLVQNCACSQAGHCATGGRFWPSSSSSQAASAQCSCLMT
jgi:L-alanine-DL-glutamate epimerase-like enolase superfamily enzyme